MVGEQPLRSSFCGRWPSAASLVRAGLVGMRLLLDVCGFSLVLARGWHEPDEPDRIAMKARRFAFSPGR